MSRVDQFISPTAEGSSRHGEFHQQCLISGGTSPNSTGVTKNGRRFTMISATDAWGLGGEASTRTTRNGSVCWQKRAGAIFFDFCIPLVVTQPSLAQWRDGLYVIEFVGSWPFNTTTGIEYGMVFGFQDLTTNLRPISLANQGFAIYSDLGVLRFGVRGPVGLTVTNLPNVGANADVWQKVRVEFRHATSGSPGSVQVFMNDAGSPSAQILTSAANFPAQGAAGVNSTIRWGFGTANNTDYFLFRDVGFWMGPNTPIGM